MELRNNISATSSVPPALTLIIVDTCYHCRHLQSSLFLAIIVIHEHRLGSLCPTNYFLEGSMFYSQFVAYICCLSRRLTALQHLCDII